MANLTQLIAETAFLLGDAAGNRWKQAIATNPVLGANDVQYLLNRSAEEFNALTGVYHATLNVVVTSGVATASLKDSLGNPPYGPLLRLEDANGKALLKTTEGALNLTVGDQWQNTKPGAPQRYLRGLDSFGTVRLWPTPASNATFVAYVTAMPKPMTKGTDLPWIGDGANQEASPAHYHSALPFGAAWQGLLWNQSGRDLELAQMFKQEFEARAQRAAAEVKAAMEG